MSLMGDGPNLGLFFGEGVVSTKWSFIRVWLFISIPIIKSKEEMFGKDVNMDLDLRVLLHRPLGLSEMKRAGLQFLMKPAHAYVGKHFS